MSNPITLVIVGLVVGLYSGIMGLGGGTLMIPILVLLLGFDHHKAVGTSLAVMIPPVTLGAVFAYYKEGRVDIATAAWIALGVAVGAYFGGSFANTLPQNTLKLIFGFVLIYVAGYTIFGILGREHLVRTIIFAAVLAGITAGFYLTTQWYDRRHAPMATISPAASTPASATSRP